MLEQSGRRALVGATIAVVHAFALYALATAQGHRDVTTSAPLAVNFISAIESKRHWQPPAVTTVTPVVAVRLPDMPVIELPALPIAPDRAISVAPQQIAPAAAEEDRSAPKLVTAVEYLREPVPRYPAQSRRLREQGLVILRVVIDEHGTASSIEIESSSGYVRLDHAAREAVARAAFRPYVEDGTPRRALVLIPIEFALNSSAA